MRLSGKERQRKWLEKQRNAGFTAVTLIVPPSAVADLQLIAEALRAMTGLSVVAVLRSAAHFVSARRVLSSCERPRDRR